MVDNLKPCPFCGAESSVNYGRGGTIAYVRCEGCGVYSPHFTTKQEAVEFWNTRAERTCTPTYEYHGEPFMHPIYVKEFSCGHEFRTYDPDEVPNYCEECGAKVVK